ncbi:MAG: hypothetical protein G01um10143_326 [Parcubacteria group bacterium Gr01-1014_3]|nr:MAG: hypothetical protein G01um10143_326 [Parcubacteria group bacterium Gr01-1014_3]
MAAEKFPRPENSEHRESLEHFFAESLARKIKADDDEATRLDKYRRQEYDPEEKAMIDQQIKDGVYTKKNAPIPAIPEEKIEKIEHANAIRAKILESWPVFMKKIAEWNPEMELEPTIEDLGMTATEFIDQEVEREPEQWTIFAMELDDLANRVLDDFQQAPSPEGVMETAQKLFVIKKAFKILEKTDFYSKEEGEDEDEDIWRETASVLVNNFEDTMERARNLSVFGRAK